MAKIIPFKISRKEDLDRARKALNGDDPEDAITVLRKVLGEKENCPEASVLLARTYVKIGVPEKGVDELFKALTLRISDEAENSVKYALAVCFSEMGEFEVAEYYLDDFIDGFDDADFSDDFFESEHRRFTNNNLHLSYPVDEAANIRRMKEAYEHLQNNEFEESLKSLEQIDENSESSAAADHMKLVCMMMRGDLDGTIEIAKQVLSKRDSLSTRCTLATAYFMEEKPEQARAEIAKMLGKDSYTAEEILLMLPVLMNANEHAEVEKLTKQLVKERLQANFLIWRAQALYNLGRREEARKVMLRVKRVFGEDTPAQYYLDLFKTQPNEVDYSLGFPVKERVNRCSYIEECLKLNDADFKRLFDEDAYFRSILDWAFDEVNPDFLFRIILKMGKIGSGAENFLRRRLIVRELSFETMRFILGVLLNGGDSLDCDLVAQYRFKRIKLRLPSAFYLLPKTFKAAVGSAICDIIYTDEEPNTYLERLRTIVNEIVTASDTGEAQYLKPSASSVASCRSEATFVGVLLSKVYEDDDEYPQESAIERYELNPRTFSKYYKILFGDDDGKR